MREIAERIGRGRRAITLAKAQGMDTSEWERCLRDLFEEAGHEPTRDEGLEPLMLWDWRRASIPEWRRILKKSVESGDHRREEYARWMLRDILLDPDYEELI